MTIFQIQQALAARGFDPGNIDGIWGRRTAAAVRAFQTSRGLVADGVVGPRTLAALGLDDAPAKDAFDDPALPWLQEARRLIGVREAPGAGPDNPVILDWADNLGLDYDHDQIAWCGLFVAHCVGATLGGEPLPANPLGARSWMKFGAPTTPQPGAIMVFWRKSLASWEGHVGLYAGENPDKGYYILGGNQSDSVCYAWLDPDRLLGARWPATAPAGSGKKRPVADDGKPRSTNEA